METVSITELQRENEHLRAEVVRLQEELSDAAGRDGLDEREKLLEEVERHRAFLQELIDSATVGIAVVHGPLHIYEMANPAYLGLVGVAGKSIIGLPLMEALPASVAAGEKWLLDSVYANNKIVSIREYEAPIEGRETYWDIDHVPLHDEAERVSRVLILAREVTEDVRARRRIALSADLERSTQTLRTLIDILPAGILVSDAAGHIIMENEHARRLTEGPATGDAYQPRGRYQMLYLNGEQFPVSDLPLPRALQEGAVSENIEILFRFEDRREVIINASGSPVRNENGELVGAVTVMQDISERKAAERERELRLERQTALIEKSYEIVGEKRLEGLLEAAVEAARTLTDCRLAVIGHNYREGAFAGGIVSREGDEETCQLAPPALQFKGVHLRLAERKRSLRLTQEQLEEDPQWWGLPDGHVALRGLLGAPLLNAAGEVSDVLLLTDKKGGDFTPDDEALLVQLTTLTSLGLQHIEARREVEQRARELEAIFAALTDVVIVYGPSGEPIKANPVVGTRYGFDPVAMTRERMRTELNARHPDGSPFTQADLPSSRALRGETVIDEPVRIATPRQGEIIVANSTAPLMVKGKVVGAVGAWHDITEREQLLERVQQERRLLETVLRQIPEGIAIAEAPSGRIVLSNTQLTEYLGERFSAQSIAEYAHHQIVRLDGRPLTPADWPLARAVAAGETVVNELLTVIRKNGSRMVMSVSAAPVHNRGGEIVAAVSTMYEVDPTTFTPRY